MNGPEDMLNRQQEDADLQAFEESLSRALRRVDAPPNLAARVLACAGIAADAQPSSRHKWSVPWLSSRWWIGSAIAAMLTIGIFAGEQVHREHERAAATQQFETATRIADQALAHTREQLRQAGVPGIDGNQ